MEADYAERRLGVSLPAVDSDTMRNLKEAVVVLAMGAICMTAGCSSAPDAPAPPEELSPPAASALILQRWSKDELNHFTVTFHSDSLIACGLQNDLWKRVETTYKGLEVVTYEPTQAGRKSLFSIDLKESGKFHEITLQGPYVLEITGISPGPDPDSRQVAFHWEIDWNKAPAGLKTCLPRFELSGSQTALFKVLNQQWAFDSYVAPGDAPPAAQAAEPAVPSLGRQ